MLKIIEIIYQCFIIFLTTIFKIEYIDGDNIGINIISSCEYWCLLNNDLSGYRYRISNNEKIVNENNFGYEKKSEFILAEILAGKKIDGYTILRYANFRKRHKFNFRRDTLRYYITQTRIKAFNKEFLKIDYDEFDFDQYKKSLEERDEFELFESLFGINIPHEFKNNDKNTDKIRSYIKNIIAEYL